MKSTSLAAHEIPAARGTYALLLLCQRSQAVPVGKLGTHAIPRGWYVYVGSACGPGGLRARCRHHLRALNRPHWHIDYLRPAASLRAVWITRDSSPREHLWAAVIREMKNAGMPIPGFGSSDCACPTHLLHFPTKPSFSIFQRLVLHRAPGHAPIMVFSAPLPRQARRNVLWCLSKNPSPCEEKTTMIAYFVHDPRKMQDTIYLPDRGCFVPVDKAAMERFISVKPDFAGWTGQACAHVTPEEFGTVVATREDPGDVCITHQDLWRERMFANLGSPMDRPR